MGRVLLRATGFQCLWGPPGVRKLGSCQSLVEIGWVVVMSQHFCPPPMSRLSPLLQPEPDLSQTITGANRAMMSMGMVNAKVIEAGAHRVCHTVSIQNGSLLSFLGTACHHPIPRSPR